MTKPVPLAVTELSLVLLVVGGTFALFPSPVFPAWRAHVAWVAQELMPVLCLGGPSPLFPSKPQE